MPGFIYTKQLLQFLHFTEFPNTTELLRLGCTSFPDNAINKCTSTRSTRILLVLVQHMDYKDISSPKKMTFLRTMRQAFWSSGFRNLRTSLNQFCGWRKLQLKWVLSFAYNWKLTAKTQEQVWKRLSIGVERRGKKESRCNGRSINFSLTGFCEHQAWTRLPVLWMHTAQPPHIQSNAEGLRTAQITSPTIVPQNTQLLSLTFKN